MKPTLKYWIFIAGISGAIFGVIFASVAGSWMALSGRERDIVAGLAFKILPFPVMGAVVLALAIGGLVSLLFRYYIIPVLRMAESTQLITLANPGYRITPEGAREVRHLAEVVNAAAAAYETLRVEVDAFDRSAQAELKEERNRFAALMSELPWGVLACTIDGRILLYNRQAQALLHLPVQSQAVGNLPGSWLGLGRSVFGVLPREPLVRGLELLQQAVDRGGAAPITGFMSPHGAGCLRVTMAPVFGFHCEQHGFCLQCERRQMTGLVLTLEEMTQGAGTDPLDELVVRPADGSPEPGAASPPAPRPIYYEFDLFNQQGIQEFASQPLRKLTYVVFDTETTGLDPVRGDEIIQIGAVRIVNGRILQNEVIDQLVDPQRSIPEASAAIHGITRDMVSGQPTIGQVLPHFHRFVEGAVLVAHNAAFDMRCLQLKESQTGIRFANPVLDTLLLSSVVHPLQDSHALDAIAQRLNLAIVGRHTALGDALATAEVFLKLIPLLEARGITTLEAALKASRSSPYAKLTY